MKRDQEQHGAYAVFVDMIIRNFENSWGQNRDEDQLNMRLEQTDAGEEGVRQVEESELMKASQRASQAYLMLGLCMSYLDAYNTCGIGSFYLV